MAKRKRRASAHKKKSKRATRTTRRKRTSKRGRSRTRAKPAPLRTIEFHEPTNAHIVRDHLSAVRQILHTNKAVAIKAANALDAAVNYLRSYGNQLGLQPKGLERLHLQPQTEPTDVGVEDRFLSEKRQFDTTTVTFQQTCLGLPVWRAGTSVHLRHLPDSFEIVSCQTAGHDEAAYDRLRSTIESVMRRKLIDPLSLAQQLGITKKTKQFDVASLQITHQSLMVYRYEANKRLRVMPLPRVAPEIADRSYNVVSAVYFDISRKGRSPTHWVALVETKTLSVLYLEEFSAHVSGLVFPADPTTMHGGPSPTASDAKLNRCRSLENLPNLVQGNPQKLVGTNIEISDFMPPDNELPTEAPGVPFSFNARTDKFAAVNAYYNCDRFFGFIESLGFTRAQYFPKQTFPIKVDPRGSIPGHATGDAADAQTNGKIHNGPGGSSWGEIESVFFLLADPHGATPLGIACDRRVVLHELAGHGTLLNHVASTHFGFAHSAGDSFAAILSDPASKARNKNRTFPWLFNQLGFDRMHNRKPSRDAANDWSWDGPIDKPRDGTPEDPMNQEQILSSTHFRFYKAIGGSDTQLKTREFAARYACYLMLRAIQTLTPATRPHHAGEWLGTLIAADSGDWTSEGHSGGAYAKVLRWAFEKQGLFGGKPPDVDVYIDDGRKGEYAYNPDYAKCPAIWNRNQADGKEGHQAPIPNAPNFVYVKIKNRGSSVAKSVTVDAFQANPGSALVYPDDWKKMNTPQLAAPDIPARSRGTKVGPFRWIPAGGSNAILMAVSATGDPNNLSNFTPGKTIPDWRLVPNDNNLGIRRL